MQIIFCRHFCVLWKYSDLGHLPYDQKFRHFWNRDKWYGNFLGKVPENPEIVEFPKSELFKQKFRKFRDESQMEQKFPGKNFQKFGYTSWGCPLFQDLCKFPIFYSVLASSFGRNHSELDISRKDDGNAHSIKETSEKLSSSTLGKDCTICPWKFPEIRPGIFDQMVSSLDFRWIPVGL